MYVCVCVQVQSYGKSHTPYYCCFTGLPGIILNTTEGTAGDLDKATSSMELHLHTDTHTYTQTHPYIPSLQHSRACTHMHTFIHEQFHPITASCFVSFSFRSNVPSHFSPSPSLSSVTLPSLPLSHPRHRPSAWICLR